ncbi:MAG: rhodanese-like domain-containing protein [Desulfobacterales bacterium]|jgi:rhodanese-related sulfurtransferase/rubrerythrin|nr:rhodanese-like domain-containing protein [Desulfobacterales bacterium]
MRWRQFFTPVRSLEAIAAKDYLGRRPADAVTLLDVRQPEEYEAGHLPGAKLVPLPELSGRLSELDPGKPTLVYCAIGGRSRIAAQLLAAKGFADVFNLSGGIKAWNGGRALGREDLGLELFSGAESAEQALVAAYGLEEGLRDFYQRMASRVTHTPARRLFEKLAAVEAKHQDRIVGEYARLTGSPPDRERFVRVQVRPAMEGGLTTEEYLARYRPDMENPVDVISLAMAIEAQALDLYQRAADRAATGEVRSMLSQTAREEQAHLGQLGELFTHPGLLRGPDA